MFLKNPVHYTKEELRTMILGVRMGSWRPKFPTLHNTGVPSLKTYMAYGPTSQAQFAANQDHYESGLGWHSGVHFFACPEYIWNTCDLTQDGVSVSCWNHVTVGVEMVGDYEVGADDFTSGPGAGVRDNAIYTLAALCEKFEWDPGNYVQGVSGLHFHRECTNDHHACPGSKVVKADVVARVQAQLALFRAASSPVVVGSIVPPPPTPVPATRIATPGIITLEDAQAALNRLGRTPPLDVDGVIGPNSIAALKDFQTAHGITSDGVLGPQTRAALVAALK